MIYFTPGPSQLYPTVKKDIIRALDEDILSVSHRSEKYTMMVKEIYEGLKKLLTIPDNYSIFFLSSATEAMERILQNCVEEKSFHFVNGAFAKRFYHMAHELGKHPEAVLAEVGKGFEFEKIDIPPSSELICITQTETSSGIALRVKDIDNIKKMHPKSLIAVDIVSSAPYVKLDFSKLDLVFFSVQKGFGLPAGLGILIASPRALKKSLSLMKKGISVGSYHNFQTLGEYAEKYQTIETPNVLEIYLFNKVIKNMLNIGIETIRQQTEEKANLLYSYFEQHREYKPFVKDINLRSATVIAISTPKGSKPIIQNLKEQGIVVGSGYGELKDKQIRLANFPAHTIEHIEQLINAL